MQNVPVGWGDAVDAVMLPMELGWNQAIRRGPPNVGARANFTQNPVRSYRGVSERQDECFLEVFGVVDGRGFNLGSCQPSGRTRPESPAPATGEAAGL